MFEDSLFKEIFESGAKTKLLIVPAQLTLSAEQAAFAYAKCDVFFDFHVMSGNKLRAEIMNKTGGPGRTPINSLGRDMILRRIAKENFRYIRAASQVPSLSSTRAILSCR